MVLNERVRRWRPGPRIATLILALLVVAATAPLRASVVVPLTLTQLTEAAATIVDGTVTDVRVVEGPSGVERLVLVQVAATWKGDNSDTTLYVHLPGGRLGRVETIVPGAPQVAPGDRLVWFLGPHPRGGHVVLGLHQGLLRTETTPDGQAVVVAPSRLAGTRGQVWRRPKTLQSLAAEVRALVAGGVAQ